MPRPRAGTASGADAACPWRPIVLLGLSSIKRLTARTRAAIVRERPFVDLRDLLVRVAPARAELEALVRSGACDDLAPLSPDVYPIAHEDLLMKLLPAMPASALDDFVVRRAHGPRAALHRALVRVRNELVTLEMHASAHPLGLLRDEATRVGAVPIASLDARPDCTSVRIVALVAASRRLAQETRSPMQPLTFEDETGVVESVLISETYEALMDPVQTPGPYIVEGVVERERFAQLVVTGVSPFYERPRAER